MRTPCFRQVFFEATGSNCPPKIRGTVEAAIPIHRVRPKQGVCNELKKDTN